MPHLATLAFISVDDASPGTSSDTSGVDIWGSPEASTAWAISLD